MLAALVCLTTAAAADETLWGYHPPPLIPADNALSPDRISLGQRLFHEPALSVNRTTSCATCHQPERHFTDGRTRAIGALGEAHPHNTPTLYNTAYNASYGWRDDGLTSLEAQHRIPLFNHAPVEMGYEDGFTERLADDPSYVSAFDAAYGTPITTDTIIKALASYVRTLTAPETAFDRYLFYDEPLDETARTGMTLFFSERLGCGSCHAAFTLSGPINHAAQRAEPVFHVTGVGGSASAFRAPTLRQVQHTGPYMHDGSLETLEDVISHYQATDAERVPEFELSNAERAALLAFLRTL